jgi:hypothetical protein
VKKVIELLERARSDIVNNYVDEEHIPLFMGEDVVNLLNEALAILKAPPRWETPEQRKERTGEDWPDMNAVYVQAYKDYQGTGDWEPQYEWGVALHCEVKGLRFTIICATEAGKPPDGWVPD